MSRAERGLFEQISAIITDKELSPSIRRQFVEIACKDFEQRLAEGERMLDRAKQHIADLEHYEEMVICACGEFETFDSYRRAMEKLTAPRQEPNS